MDRYIRTYVAVTSKSRARLHLTKSRLNCPMSGQKYRIVLNSRPGVYFLPEVLDPALIRDRRLIETGVK